MHDQPARRGLARERDLCDARIGCERFSSLGAKSVDDVENTGGQKIANKVHQHHEAHGRLLGWLHDDAVAGRDRGGNLPGRHEDREVPRDDLSDDAEWLVEVIGDRRLVDFR